ncbi:MAG: GNAT family N-acetyltransferase [Sphingomonadales bacterium]
MSPTDSRERYALRLLEPGDAAAVHRVHLAALRALEDPGFLYARELRFFEDLLEGGGIVVGAEAEGCLVGYAAMFARAREVNGFAADVRHLGLSAADIAETAGAAVDPDHQRHGVFPLLFAERFRHLRALRVPLVAFLVARGNIGSLKITLRAGCLPVANHPDADGDNILLVKCLDGRPEPRADDGLFVPLAAWPEHFAILDDGRHFGVPVTRGGEPGVSYVEAGRFPAAPAYPCG